MVSRLCLALEYGAVLFYTRRYKKARPPIAAMVAVNAISAFVYLAISFQFHGSSSRVFISWYPLCAGACRP